MVPREYLQGSSLARNTGGKTDFDLFYNVGMVVSRRSKPITMGTLSHELDIPINTAN
jgi:hypothetical protein